MAIYDHPLWPVLRPLVRVQTYDRDGGHAHPRHRIEVIAPVEPGLRAQILTMQIPCARCGRSINPIRTRNGGAYSSHWYLNVSCELSRSLGCARSRAAHDAYEAIVAAVAGMPAPTSPQGMLEL